MLRKSKTLCFVRVTFGVVMPSFDDRIEDNFVIWARFASTPEAFYKLSRELGRIWAENPHESAYQDLVCSRVPRAPCGAWV